MRYPRVQAAWSWTGGPPVAIPVDKQVGRSIAGLATTSLDPSFLLGRETGMMMTTTMGTTNTTTITAGRAAKEKERAKPRKATPKPRETVTAGEAGSGTGGAFGRVGTPPDSLGL